ncbi:tetratricopeptide repeat protein [Colwellia sp. MB02u-9]|uniref:tetratricopeptide repeat protein n=1 Tax=Colwellia sp. MB02u-9 TaxID=2759823 RepID=UPI0015F52547|nr:tetratricopeptide repeat protein [Colwellia sp. MB02u-9]MBA6294434.1 sel1 repeat family protein [Colwellia sp. MB02u-9]
MFKVSRVKNSNNGQVQRLNLSAFIPSFKHFIASKKSLLIPVLFCLAYYSYYVIYQTNRDQQQTRQIVATPKINDIYLFDFRIVSHNLRPNEKYRIAKVVDITGDIITLVYGSFYYPNQHATINSIYYGQLTYKDYFEAKRFDYNHQQIQQKLASGAIYQAMRPINDKLLGQRVGPEPRKYRSNIFIQGRRENLTGEAFLNQRFSETNLKQAFELFTTSANYNFAQGQVNLAQMYINGQYVEKNLSKALYWLNQAALQSHKPAILKYEIICKQLSSCQIYDFFKNLVTTGVNIKVRSLSTELTVEK